jgi:hypothetical protein
MTFVTILNAFVLVPTSGVSLWEPAKQNDVEQMNYGKKSE